MIDRDRIVWSRSSNASRLLSGTLLVVIGGWAVRHTLINGIIYPLTHGKFHGDFSEALSEVGWIKGACYLVSSSSNYYEFHRGLEFFYGPLFTLLQYAIVENRCVSGILESTTRIDLDQFLLVITGINLLLVTGCIYLVSKIFSFRPFETMVVSAIWLLDSHLSYSLSVAAILEFFELFLILGCIQMIRMPSPKSQIASGLFLGLAVAVKVSPLIMLPLLFYKRSHVLHRVSGFITSISIIMLSTCLFLRVSPLRAIRDILSPPSFSLVSTHIEVRSLGAAIARTVGSQYGSPNFQTIGTSSTIVILLLYATAIGITIWLRRIKNLHDQNGGSDDSGLLLLTGLLFSILPMTTITHRHTYLFLLPTYAFIYLFLTRTHNSRTLIGLKVTSVLMYLWLSQSLLTTLLDKSTIGIPSIVLEEAFPNLIFVIIIILAACFYERSKWVQCSVPYRSPPESTG